MFLSKHEMIQLPWDNIKKKYNSTTLERREYQLEWIVSEKINGSLNCGYFKISN